MSTNHILLTILSTSGLWTYSSLWTPALGYNLLPLSKDGGDEMMECYDCYSVVEHEDQSGVNEQVLGFACFHYLDSDKYPDELNHTEASKRFRYFTVNSEVQSGDLFCTTVVGQVVMKPYGFLPWDCQLGLCMDTSNAIIAKTNSKNSKNDDLVGQKTIRMKPPGPKLRNCVGASLSHVLERFQDASKTNWQNMIGGLTFRDEALRGKPVTDLEICRCKQSRNCRIKMNKLLFPRLRQADEEGTAGMPQEVSYPLMLFAFVILFISYF